MVKSAVVLSIGAVALLMMMPTLALAAPVARAAGSTLPFFTVTNSSSSNWAGYAVTGAKNSVTFVNGSWTQPTATGCVAGKQQYASFWVGIDGYNSNSVEQTGTDSDCNGATATYYAWFEFYPNPSHTITTVPIHAGDVIYAQVSFSSTTLKFTVTLKDVTTSKSFTTSHAVRNAQRSSAEWIAEAPSSIGVLPLADFGTVHFGFQNTALAATNSATVGGTTGVIGSFSTVVSIKMTGAHNSALVKAVTSALSTDGTSFNDTWKAAGP